MELDPPHCGFILTRRKLDYKYYNPGVWHPFVDSEKSSTGLAICSKRPDFRRFELVSDTAQAHDSITFHTCQPNTFYKASTPWGEMEIIRSGLAKYEVRQGTQTIGRVKEGFSGMRAVFSFPLGEELVFRGRLLWYRRMMVKTEMGSASVVCQSSRAIDHDPQRKRLGRAEFNRLSPDEKLAVTATNRVVTWRISFHGLLPIKDEDVLKLLVMEICRFILYSEYTSTLG